MVDALPFSRLLELALVLPALKQEEAKDRLIEQAFLAFQMGTGGKETFGEYLNGLGLGDKQTVQQAKEQTVTPEALAILKSLANETAKRKQK